MDPKIVLDLHLDWLVKWIKNWDRLLCKCKNSLFSDIHHKHIVTGDPQNIKNDFLLTLLWKDLNVERLGCGFRKR